jgi:hypothetical protein
MGEGGDASPAKQVLTDTTQLAERLQNTLTFQLAGALQTTLVSFLDPALTLAGVLLLSFFTTYAQSLLGWEMRIARRILLAVLGQVLMAVVDAALLESAASTHSVFLLRTGALCVPSVLGAISPVFLDNEYAQSSISVLLYAYAQGSEQMLRGVDFGAPPLYLCVLAAVLARRAASEVHADLSILHYLFRGWRMLLINLLLTSLQQHALGSPTWSRMALSLGLVLAIDVMGLTSRSLFQDVRGYAVFKTAQYLADLQPFSLDAVTTLAVCVLLISTRAAAAQVHEALRSKELMHAAHSVGDVVFVASVNALLQEATGDSESAPVTVRLLRVSFVCVLVYRAQDMLQEAGR